MEAKRSTSKRYPPEVKDQAVRLVCGARAGDPRDAAAIGQPPSDPGRFTSTDTRANQSALGGRVSGPGGTRHPALSAWSPGAAWRSDNG